MNDIKSRILARPVIFQSGLAVALFAASMAASPGVLADDDGAEFKAGNLLLGRTVYDNNPNNVVVGSKLPPNCLPAKCVTATDDGTYPTVWNNDAVDGSFGITSKIMLDQLKPNGFLLNSLEVPNSSQRRVTPGRDQMVTSFPSKSELALNLSTDGRFVTFMGYLAPINALDVSNANTPAVIDPTNPVPGTNLRVVAQVDQEGQFRFTETNAYSGNNGRAAIMNNQNGAHLIYMSGNAGNGGNPQPNGVIIGAGAQIVTAANAPMNAQSPADPTPLGSFNITQLGRPADKVGKDTNFRGLTIFNNVVYYSKGSGGNGINTVYFIDTSGFDSLGRPLACPNGVGLPAPGATLPTSPIIYDATVLQTKGVTPFNMCILKGFPTALSSKTSFPFGIWFADAKTVYVADEGDGTNTFNATTNRYTVAAAQTTAGLQKWVFDATLGAWKLAYVLQAGLDLGVPYTVDGYPTGLNPKTRLPWSPATDGLRNITGKVNRDGTATIYGITSTVSGNGDQGADPNKLVTITDQLAATSLPTSERFATVRSAGFGEALRGVSFTPGTRLAQREDGIDESRSCSGDDSCGRDAH
jgi:hypothetical protein